MLLFIDKTCACVRSHEKDSHIYFVFRELVDSDMVWLIQAWFGLLLLTNCFLWNFNEHEMVFISFIYI